MATNIEINTLKGQSTHSSTNSSRVSSVQSNISSTGYVEQIQALVSCLRTVKKSKPWIGLITRKLNGISSTKLSTLYTLLDSLCYYYI